MDSHWFAPTANNDVLRRQARVRRFQSAHSCKTGGPVATRFPRGNFQRRKPVERLGIEVVRRVQSSSEVRKVPGNRLMHRSENGRSLNDLVGAGKQCRRQVNAERPGSLQVENQIVF